LPHDHHIVRIATERRDIVPDPLQRQHEVLHADRRRRGIGRPHQVAQIEIAEDVEPMIDADRHDVAETGEAVALIDRLRA
jgi:hypothetical protein